MLPILHIGPLALQLPGLILLFGLWLGLSLAERYSSRCGISPDRLYNLVLISLIASLAGARLFFAIRYPAAFTANPASLISPNLDLFDPFGGAASGVLAGLIYSQRKGLALWGVLDALTPVLAVLAVSLGLAHLASGNAFGAATSLPWGIELWGARRQPTQIYETVGAALILFAIWPGRERTPGQAPGSSFLSFLILTATLRLFLEAFRGDSVLLDGGVRAAQVAALFILGACLWMLGRRLKWAP